MGMDVVTIDFETYYDSAYSLSKMTTEAYIRDPRFEVIGVGVKLNHGPADWYSGDNPGAFLRSLDYSDKAILCHHTAFDGAILAWHFGIKPKLWLDTVSMSRPRTAMTVGASLKALAAHYGLGAKGDEVVRAIGKRRKDFTPDELRLYGSYCINDVELTHKLFRKMSAGFPVSEIRVIDQTIRMFTEPQFVLDTPMLREHLLTTQEKKQELLNSIVGAEHAIEGDAKTILMSNNKLAELLLKLGVDPPTKVSLKTGKETWAFGKTDKAFLALQDHENPAVSTLISARLGVKSTIEESRTESLLSVASRGPLPIMLNYYGAHTGRFSGGDKMNLQNLPRGGTLRKSLRAPKGKVLVACDSSQIEARMVAWLAGQNDLLDAFRAGRDIYSEFASDIYGRTVTKADKVDRFVGKTSILGLGYGMGAEKFQRTLELGQGGVSVTIDMHEAQRIVGFYRQKNFKIAQFWRRCQNALDHMVNGREGDITDLLSFTPDGIRLPNGFDIKYPMLRRDEKGQFCYIANPRMFNKAAVQRVIHGTPVDVDWTRIYGGKVVENLTQALARIVVSEQMAAIGKRYKVVLQVHDENVIICDEDEAEDAKGFMEVVMSTPPVWAPDLPVACEAGIGYNYGECK